MKSLALLDQLNLDTNTRQQVAGVVRTLLDQAQQEIQAQALKIEALTLELAHLRRIRFGKKSESFSADQRSLFEESVLIDTAAVVAEIEQVKIHLPPSPAKLPRDRAGRQPLLNICRVSNTGMNQLAVNVANAVMI